MQTFLDFDSVDKYGPQHADTTFAISGEQLGRDEVDQLEKVEIQAHADQGHLEGEYLVEGEIDMKGNLRCSRCLEPYSFANRSPFRLRYRPRPDAAQLAEEELELGESDLEVEYYSARQLDLGELASEQLQLSLPMKPLCSDACRGLCPQCGQNLNAQPCWCSTQTEDPRWAALRQIRNELQKK
ncbi:MAG TPA: DUF177 domain-containing protein [Thermoanaerobaculia bacterium]|nr:DUF177 domain-containing protein [Thermoanaerobaculia bacterium]